VKIGISQTLVKRFLARTDMLQAVATEPVEQKGLSALEAALLERLKAIPDGRISETARRAGVSAQALFRLRRGESPDVRISTFVRLAAALDAPVSWPDPPPPPPPVLTLKGDEFVTVKGAAGGRLCAGSLPAMDELLIAEIERLRALVVGAYPYVPEGPATTGLVLEMAATIDAFPGDWEPIRSSGSCRCSCRSCRRCT
jgi:transcriptional regulator with XRE-family HTH domain